MRCRGRSASDCYRTANSNDVRGPVSRVLSCRRFPACMGSHSSRRDVAAALQQPTRTVWARNLPVPACAGTHCPYSVLLRVGFTMPLPLPAARCALTAPFHPYLTLFAQRRKSLIGGLLSVALSLNSGASPQIRRALPATLVSWSPDFPRPSNPPMLSVSKGAAARPPDAAQLASSGSSSKLSRITSNSNSSAPVSPSTSPSMIRGRKRRWKARTAAWPSAMS